MIVVYNRNTENHSDDINNYPIYRPNILSNPYTHIKDKKTLASYVVDSREKAIEAYDRYFDVMYSGNKEFKATVDEIYEKYKNGETIYLECYCKKNKTNETMLDDIPCHGDIIKKKIEKRFIKNFLKNGNNQK